eukprot:CFRG7687T1
MAPKKKQTGVLGKSIMKARFGADGRRGHTEGWVHTTELPDGYQWDKGLQSVTDANDLDEFLQTAQLTGQEFVGEKLNVKVVSPDAASNSAVLSLSESISVKDAQEENLTALRIPRRPAWDENTTASELNNLERESFVEWRRGLATIQKKEHIHLTPFEKNLEVWRQLWRVVERSDLIVQIVDARNPLLFYCEDVETYVEEMGDDKQSLLLINKADMLTDQQRRHWANYLEEKGIKFCFWSANVEIEKQEAAAKQAREEEDRLNNALEAVTIAPVLSSISDDTPDSTLSDDETTTAVKEDIPAVNEINAEEDVHDDILQVLDAEGLLALFKRGCPLPSETRLDRNGKKRVPTVGLVGYPNVGKSSTINALCGAKLVSVSATPGKTKHFQTLMLERDLQLCDCPGLVFPSFVATQAELTCNGVLPIDHLRDPIPPMSLLVRRIARDMIEETYGMYIIKPSEDDPNQSRPPTAHEMLHSYGRHRGFMTSHGLPDIQRSARIILKDFVKGKLMYCHPPPEIPELTYNTHLSIGMGSGPDETDYSEADTAALYSTSGKTRDQDYHYADKTEGDRILNAVQAKTTGKSAHAASVTKHASEIVTSLTSTERDDKGRPVGKPWRKHNNKGKNEKTRRVYEGVASEGGLR